MLRKTNKTTSQTTSAQSCDWKPALKKRASANKNRILKHKGAFKWCGVSTEKYKQKEGGWSSIVRNVLIGNHGETSRFHLRYFEIAPGGNSSLEHHRHEHVVICIRGRGKVLINKKSHSIGYLDTVYVAPNTVHQLLNPYNEPFGFFCIVNAKRDRPKLVRFIYGRKS